MAPPPKRDSAVSPCFHGCLAFLHQHFPPQSPPSHPLIHLSTVNSSPRPGIAPQSLNSSSPPLHLPGDQHSCPGFVWLQQGLSDSHSIQAATNQLFHSLKCFSSDSDSCPDVGMGPLLQFPHPPRAGPVLLTLLFFPQFLHPTKFCVVLCILFCWSGTPVHSELLFCMHFCV